MIELNVLQSRFFESKLLAHRKVQASHILFIDNTLKSQNFHFSVNESLN